MEDAGHDGTTSRSLRALEHPTLNPNPRKSYPKESVGSGTFNSPIHRVFGTRCPPECGKHACISQKPVSFFHNE